MKKLFLNLSSLAFVLMVCLFTLNVNAQEGKGTERVFTTVEDPPSFPGREKALSNYLAKNIIYPKDARDKGIEGKVYVSFIINKEGSVTDVKVIRGVGKGLDEEALRAVQNMPKWIPGKQKGKKVSVQYTLPIVFKLDKDEKLNDNSELLYNNVDEPAKFPGGDEKLSEFLRTNIKYPNSAKEDGTQGKVYIQFVVQKDGSLSEINLLKGIQKDCDEEAIRVVKLMPKWEPGKLKGEIVRVKFTLPIVFQLR